MICVNCDHTITGDYALASHGYSMFGARLDAYAHPPRSSECRLHDRSRAAFRRELDAPKLGTKRRS